MPTEAPKSSHRPEDRWAAILRTQRKMAPPPGGEDIGALLAKSMDAYWAKGEPMAAVEMEDMSSAFVRAASWFRQDSFKKEFWSDFALASAPVALVLLTFSGLWSFDLVSARWLPWVALGFALLVFSGAWRWRSSPTLRYSIGALAAGLIVSVSVGVLLYRQSDARTTMALLAMRGAVEEVAVSSLLGRVEEGKEWLTPQIQDEVMSLRSNRSADGVVYRAFAHHVPGEVVATLGITSGEVRWETSNQNSLQVAVSTGRLVSASKSGDWKFAATAHASSLSLWADPGRVGLQPKPGECLIIVYKPAQPKNKVERAVRLDCKKLEDLALGDLPISRRSLEPPRRAFKPPGETSR